MLAKLSSCSLQVVVTVRLASQRPGSSWLFQKHSQAIPYFLTQYLQKQIPKSNDECVKRHVFVGVNIPTLPWAARLADENAYENRGAHLFSRKLGSNLITTPFIDNVHVIRQPRRKLIRLKSGLWYEFTINKSATKPYQCECF